MSTEDPFSSGAYRSHNSFKKLTEDQYWDSVEDHYDREQDIANLSKKCLSFQTYEAAMNIITTRPMPWQEAGVVAAIEATAYETKYPQLNITEMSFPACYRFLRTLELSGVNKRGRNTLFIGSGTAVHELLAHYMRPPHHQIVKSFFEEEPDEFSLKKQRILHKFRVKDRQERAEPFPSLKFESGRAVLVEPQLADNASFYRR